MREKLQSSEARGIDGMTISVNSSVIALVGTGWKSVGGQLLASGVLLLSGYQDIGLRARMGAALGFLMAIAFGISALINEIRANLSYAVAISAMVLCSEILLILRWWLRRTSA
jgi:Ca2+/Na+ antiporter